MVGMPQVTMGVHISPVQFRHKHLPELVRSILEEAGGAAARLERGGALIESVASEDPIGATTVIRGLPACGVRMSIDDFGTGCSSPSYLKRFKVGKLKIDQSFVRGETDDSDDQAIVTAIIHMARNLGMHTIAEGVTHRHRWNIFERRTATISKATGSAIRCFPINSRHSSQR
jgi:EAL domain-containing protein (putative c-di-GMP-specific phosphodiesterase class I)